MAERAAVAPDVQPSGGPTQSEQAFQQDRLALSLQTGEPTDLTGVHREIDAGDVRAGDAEADGTQCRLDVGADD